MAEKMPIDSTVSIPVHSLCINLRLFWWQVKPTHRPVVYFW